MLSIISGLSIGTAIFKIDVIANAVDNFRAFDRHRNLIRTIPDERNPSELLGIRLTGYLCYV